MTGYAVEIEGMAELDELYRRFPEVTEKYIRWAMEAAVKLTEGNVKINAPVNTGMLRASIGSEVTQLTDGNVQGIVGTSLVDETYPVVMELGAKPFYPPPQHLERWVHLKLGVSEAEAPRVARAVAAGIARNGIKGRFFMKKGLEKSIDAVKGFFQEAVKKMLAEVTHHGY